MSAEDQSPTQPPEHMRPCEAARYLGISVSKLAKLRMRDNKGQGPAFAKLAGVVIYRRRDLDAWLADHIVGGDDDE